MRDDHVRELEQLAPAVPVRQAQERIHAEQQTQRPARKFGAQLGQRVDGVGRSRAANLAIVDDECGLAGHRGTHHRHAQRGIGERALAMRRAASRQEAHLGELERLPQLEGGAQMAVVNRIEGAAEEPDRSVTVRYRWCSRGTRSGERQGLAAREFHDDERHLVPGIAALLTLDHAIGARDARRETRVRQLSRAALRGVERGGRPLPAARAAILLRRAPGVVDLAGERPQRQRRLDAFAAQSRENAQRARHVGAERGFAQLEDVEARAVGDRCLHGGEVDRLPRGAQSRSFSSSCCAASRLPSVCSTMNRTASSSSSSSIAFARARSHCGSLATSTGQSAATRPRNRTPSPTPNSAARARACR